MTRYYEDTDPGMEREAEEEERMQRRADADAEMAEMTRVGNMVARAHAAGRCTHGSAAGYINPPVYPEQVGLEPGQLACTAGCGAVFDSDEEWLEAMDKAIRGR